MHFASLSAPYALLLALVCTAALAAGCATGAPPTYPELVASRSLVVEEGGRGGLVVSGRADADLQLERLVDYALLHAAEAARLRGFDAFQVVDVDSGRRRTAARPGAMAPPAGGGLQPAGPETPPRASETPYVRLDISLVRSGAHRGALRGAEPPRVGSVYDAGALIDDLYARYGAVGLGEDE